MSSCPPLDVAASTARVRLCRDGAAATHLKLVSLVAILVASLCGIASPVLLARRLEGKPLYAKALLVIKCFAAGVILSTSLVHVLPDAVAALSDCHLPPAFLSFPFSGLLVLIGVLLALLVDLVASGYSEEGVAHGHGHESYARIDKDVELRVGGGEVDADEEDKKALEKQKMVSKVLEIGIVFHSVIIGVAVGMSQDVCSIRPLIVALSFHQVFEGMGLGGCIAQARFDLGTVAYMCMMFSVTTPLGIVLGMVIFHMTGYDDSNPKALISEGLLGSLSAGVLIYMALVDLIAIDFFHNKMMSSSQKLKKASYCALVLGSASMSVLALWA